MRFPPCMCTSLEPIFAELVEELPDDQRQTVAPDYWLAVWAHDRGQCGCGWRYES